MIFRIVLLFIFSIAIFSCDKSEPSITAKMASKDLPDQESWSATFEVTVQGIPRAIIWSGYTAKYNKKKTINFSDSIHVDFYDGFGVHQSELFSDSGKVFNKTNDLEVWGNVIVISDSGVVLKTDLLKWNNSKQKIYTDREVAFYTATDTLYGDYFDSDPDLKNYQISNPRGISHRKSSRE